MKTNYNYKQLHADLQNKKYLGSYGGTYSIYRNIAGKKENIDLSNWNQRKENEYIDPRLLEHLEQKSVQDKWGRICSFDPFGLSSDTPTISSTTATLNIPELKNLYKDGKIVNMDGSINIFKIAIENVWNIPLLAEKLNLSEEDLRNAIYTSTNNKDILNTEIKVYIPPIGGTTIYIFGNILNINDNRSEIAVRVHDACNGSDVFGTDICTCRPYLIFAIKCAVECAQRNGVGVIVYYRKEGRALGEIIKYRVYNARKKQIGGDRPDKYFHHTENIAGIRDARLQELMPDTLLWLGINRIDWLMSMSNEKYEVLIKEDIKILQRVALPTKYIPKNAYVEINAKISDGYHSDKLCTESMIKELRDLNSIRKRCQRIFELGKENKLQHFDLNLNNIEIASKLVINSIEENYNDLNIPHHSRIRHFECQDMNILKTLQNMWNTSDIEKMKRLIDLVTISVLLDAGAGDTWKYTGTDGKVYTRSEGLAIASLDMFLSGLFSSDPAMPYRINSYGIKNLTFDKFKEHLQISDDNYLVGLKGRYKLIKRLAVALDKYPKYFGHEIRRPGNLVDHLLTKCDNDKNVCIDSLWEIIIEGMEYLWDDSDSQIVGMNGDMWVYTPLKIKGVVGSDIIPFHKLSQWLTYSIIEVLELFGFNFTDMANMTALAEYRNGGLLIDTGIIIPKDVTSLDKVFNVGAELIVEWRALTICIIDVIYDKVREHYASKNNVNLTMSQILEGGTWKAGRIIANSIRKNGRSPINIRSDGNVF